MQRVADNPPQYRYQNIYQVMMTGAQAQIDPAYEQFAEAIYGVFDNDRRLHGKDVSQCYEWVEQMHLPPDVVIAMMRHMVQKHGKNVSMKKAEQMAMRLADEKVQTVEEAQEIFRRDQTVWSGSKKVLEKLGLRRYPTEPEQTMYSKWLVDWQFTPDAILRAVDETIKSSNPSFAYLDGIFEAAARAGECAHGAGCVGRYRGQPEGKRAYQAIPARAGQLQHYHQRHDESDVQELPDHVP